MKHEIKVPLTIKVATILYKVILSEEANRELTSRSLWGSCNNHLMEIKVDTGAYTPPEQFSQTFLHETIHAVDSVYCNDKLTEDTLNGLAQGLSQVFEQLGVRFVK